MHSDDFIYAPLEIANRTEGFTEITLLPEGEALEAHQEQERLATEGLKKLTMNGGEGDGLSAQVGNEVLTVKETLALKIAMDIIADKETEHGMPVGKLNLMQLNQGIHERVKGRATTVGAVMAEIGRLQNRAIYKDRVRRR